MIYYFSSYSTAKNIGEYYNTALAMLPEPNDFACLLDGDAMFTTSDYGHQINAVLERNFDCRLFYALTNRVGCPWQVAPDAPRGDDVREHRAFGAKLQRERGIGVREVHHQRVPGSGFFLMIRKDLWQQVGPFHTTGMLGVDWQYFVRVRAERERILQMTGVYLYHWYRGGGGSPVHLS